MPGFQVPQFESYFLQLEKLALIHMKDTLTYVQTGPYLVLGLGPYLAHSVGLDNNFRSPLTALLVIKNGRSYSPKSAKGLPHLEQMDASSFDKMNYG